MITQMHIKAHTWVSEYFGGDYERAIWYLQECAKARVDTFYSLKTKTHVPIFLRR